MRLFNYCSELHMSIRAVREYEYRRLRKNNMQQKREVSRFRLEHVL
jgi:hypothetical protein